MGKIPINKYIVTKGGVSQISQRERQTNFLFAGHTDFLVF